MNDITIQDSIYLAWRIIYKKKNKSTVLVDFSIDFAEARGFEPLVPLRVHRISSATHSTTLARFQIIQHKHYNYSNKQKQPHDGVVFVRKIIY